MKKIRIDRQKAITVLQDIADVYEIGEPIGNGAFGTVYMAEHKDTKIVRAVKVIEKRDED